MEVRDTATRSIAAWVADHRRPAASPRARELATISIVDTIACALAGTIEQGTWRLMQTRPAGDGFPCSLWGMGGKAGARDAALVNGMLSHMLDYDDGDMISRGHPSCIIVPALFAVAEERRLDGAKLIDAWLTAYHVMQAIGSVAGKAMAARGYHVTSALGCVAAAAGLCRMLGLTSEQTATAMSIAATTASGLRANFGTDMKGYHAGRAAMAAVEAVEAAVAGLTACPDILEEKDGFLDVLCGQGLSASMSAAAARLIVGEISIEAEPPNIKLYPCCHSTHACIEAARELAPRLAGRLGTVREVVAEAPRMSAQYLLHSRPETGLEAKFSMEGSVALALVDGEAGIAQFSDESVSRKSVQEMIRKVRFVTSDRMEEIHARQLMPGSISITTDDGHLVHEVIDTRGCRTRPCTLEDVSGKFRDCARGVLSHSDSERALDWLCALETATDLAGLGQLLRGGQSVLATAQ